jgi:hypothetical protein
VTFGDEVLFDAPRLTGRCVSPERLDLVVVGQVWCRLLTGPQRTAARAGGIPTEAANVITTLIGSEITGVAVDARTPGTGRSA